MLEDWKSAAGHAGLSLSGYVRQAVSGEVRLDRVLQDEERARREEEQRRRDAARLLAERHCFELLDSSG